MIKVANAPVSFGVLRVGGGAPAAFPEPEVLLAAIAAAGYAGTDLGPAGYLGDGPTLRDRLRRHGLELAGGWVDFRFTAPDGFAADLAALDRALDTFQAAGGAPRPTLADRGVPARWASPDGPASRDRPAGPHPAGRAETSLDAGGWRRLAAGVAAVARRCRGRGFDPTFHHHLGTSVETPHEVERLLELTDVGLCLDTGHLLLGGGDPVRALRDWSGRVNHVHLKDARVEVCERLARQGAGVEEVWRQGAFCELGAGDLDVPGFLAALDATGYQGWVVVEQDQLIDAGAFPQAAAAQARNRAYLRRAGL